MGGTILGQIGGEVPGEAPELFNWLHSIAIDSKGDLYAAEVSFCECGKHQDPHPREMVSLRKWEVVPVIPMCETLTLTSTRTQTPMLIENGRWSLCVRSAPVNKRWIEFVIVV